MKNEKEGNEAIKTVLSRKTTIGYCKAKGDKGK